MSPRWQIVVSAVATNCLRGEEDLPTRRQEFLSLAKGENQRMKRMLLSWSGFSRGMLVFLTTDFTDYTDSSLTERACAWPPGCLFLAHELHEWSQIFFLSTDDTVFCFAVPSQVQRAAISFICAIC